MKRSRYTQGLTDLEMAFEHLDKAEKEERRRAWLKTANKQNLNESNSKIKENKNED